MAFIYLRRSRNTRSYLLIESYRDAQGRSRASFRGPFLQWHRLVTVDGRDALAGHNQDAGEAQVNALLVIACKSLQVRRHLVPAGLDRSTPPTPLSESGLTNS
jgi:hypothetical protein